MQCRQPTGDQPSSENYPAIVNNWRSTIERELPGHRRSFRQLRDRSSTIEIASAIARETNAKKMPSAKIILLTDDLKICSQIFKLSPHQSILQGKRMCTQSVPFLNPFGIYQVNKFSSQHKTQ